MKGTERGRRNEDTDGWKEQKIKGKRDRKLGKK